MGAITSATRSRGARPSSGLLTQTTFSPGEKHPDGASSSSPQVLKSSSPQVLKSSKPQVLKASSPQSLKSSKPQVLKASSPQSLKASKPQSLKASKPQSLKASKPSPQTPVAAARLNARRGHWLEHLAGSSGPRCCSCDYFLSRLPTSRSSSVMWTLRLTTWPSLPTRIIVGSVRMPSSLARRLSSPPGS